MGVDYRRTQDGFRITRKRGVGRFRRDRYTYTCIKCGSVYMRSVKRGDTPVCPKRCPGPHAPRKPHSRPNRVPREVTALPKYEVFVSCVRAGHAKIMRGSRQYLYMDARLANFRIFYKELRSLWETMGPEYRPNPVSIRVHDKVEGFRMDNVVADADERLLWYTTEELLELPLPPE